MTKRSGRRISGAEQPEPVFFIDRDLGKYTIPGALRAAGILIEPFNEHFAARPDAPDVELFPFVAQRGWVWLGGDKSQRYKKEERDAIMRCGLKCFHLVGSMPAHERANSFVEAMPQVRELIRRRHEAFIASVYRPTPTQSDHVRLTLTMARWIRALHQSGKR